MKPTARTERKSKSRGTHKLRYNKRNGQGVGGRDAGKTALVADTAMADALDMTLAEFYEFMNEPIENKGD